MDRHPLDNGVQIGLQIAGEFMPLAQRGMDAANVSPGQYFATVFNRLLAQGLAELECKPDDGKPLEIVFRFPSHGRPPAP